MIKRNTESERNNVEKDLEYEYDSCDNCNDEVHVSDLVECPSSFEEIKGNIHRNRWFCSDCCEEIFRSEGCQSDVDNCDRATQIMERKLQEYSKANGFEPFKGIEKAYINKTGTIVLGAWGVSPAKPPDKLLHQFDDGFQVFDGEEVVIARMNNVTVCFDKDIINEITAIFKELGVYRNGYLFLKKRKLLVINGIGMWAIAAPLIGDFAGWRYQSERDKFIEQILAGQKFFGLSKKDGVAIVDLKRMSFDWNGLTDQQFVELCCDIFQSMQEIEEAQITEGTGDLGQDIKAIETWKTLLGLIKRKWTIQCKHFRTRNVLPSDIVDMPNAYSQLKFDVFCLMTSSLISPSCDRLLESWKTNRTLPFTVQTWDRKKIENFLLNKPDIYAKYFGR